MKILIFFIFHLLNADFILESYQDALKNYPARTSDAHFLNNEKFAIIVDNRLDDKEI